MSDKIPDKMYRLAKSSFKNLKTGTGSPLTMVNNFNDNSSSTRTGHGHSQSDGATITASSPLASPTATTNPIMMPFSSMKPGSSGSGGGEGDGSGGSGGGWAFGTLKGRRKEKGKEADLDEDDPSTIPNLHHPSDLQLLYRTFITACHILHYHHILDSYSHLSVRHPSDPSKFIMSRFLPPALISSPDDLTEYWVEDSEPVEKGGVKGKHYSERCAHGEIYKRFGEGVRSVVHSHEERLVAFGIVEGLKLKPVFHMAGFLGPEVPTFDVSEHYRPNDKQDMLISNNRIGAALAECFGPPSIGNEQSNGIDKDDGKWNAPPNTTSTTTRSRYHSHSGAAPSSLSPPSTSHPSSSAAPPSPSPARPGAVLPQTPNSQFQSQPSPTISSKDPPNLHHPVVLMRGHGFSCVGASIEDVVLRAIYTVKNAEIMMMGMNMSMSMNMSMGMGMGTGIGLGIAGRGLNSMAVGVGDRNRTKMKTRKSRTEVKKPTTNGVQNGVHHPSHPNNQDHSESGEEGDEEDMTVPSPSPNMGGDLRYLNEAECRGSQSMAELTAYRPWGLWSREVEEVGIYVNRA